MKLDKQQEAQSAAAGDSISSVGVPVSVKDYAPSEVFTNEPPPAYRKTRATAVQIARIAAFTVIACTVILGLCIVASSYIEATASCSQLIHAEALLHHQQNDDIGDRPSYQALVDPLQSDESSESKQESIAAPPSQQHKEHGNNGAQSPLSHNQFESQSTPIQIKLPLQLDFDELAGTLMEKNQRSRMNCVVEKKRAEEVMDHQPKTVRLPFGVNITTDPRYEHVTGERMAIYCESGHDQRHMPMENMQQQSQQQAPFVLPMPMNMPMNLPMMMPHPHGPHHHPHMPGPMNHIPMSMITRAAAAAAAQEENMPQNKEESPITILAREEHIIPIFQPVIPDVQPLSSNSIEGRNMPEKILYHPAAPEARMMQDGRMLHTITIPENRPQTMAEARSMSHNMGPIPGVPSEMVRPPPPPAFHKIPIHVPTILQQVESQQQLNENGLDEEAESDPRPHYVQPRSVRSVDSVLHPREKRVRRYACQCTC